MRRAFTLIELLVVIAVIAILAAVLFPVFSQAKEAAKKTTCLSNAKSQAMALLLYLGDSDDVFPNTGEVALWAGRRYRWPLMPYLGIGLRQMGAELTASGKTALLYCPSDDSQSRFDGTSYAYAASLYLSPEAIPTMDLRTLAFGRACAPGECPGVSSTAVMEPARKAMLFEWTNAHRYETKPTGPWGTTGSAFSWLPGPERKDGARNVAFADAHAKFTSVRAMTLSHLDTPDPNVTPGGYAGSDLR